MAHSTQIRDGDVHFTIDPITRSIKNTASTKTSVIQYDHNSERFTFILPRYIEGHDMMECNNVEVHYLTNSAVSGVYSVEDLRPDETEENVVCSWLLSQNATQNAGSLHFLLRFSCVAEDGTVEYVWNTGIYKGISIASGMYNSEAIVEDYPDALAQWKQEMASICSRADSAVTNLEEGLSNAKEAAENAEKSVADAAEALRMAVQGESERTEAENVRKRQEVERVEAENHRDSAELMRDDNEVNRVESEYERIKAEQMRVEAENHRAEAEAERKEWFDKVDKWHELVNVTLKENLATEFRHVFDKPYKKIRFKIIFRGSTATTLSNVRFKRAKGDSLGATYNNYYKYTPSGNLGTAKLLSATASFDCDGSIILTDASSATSKAVLGGGATYSADIQTEYTEEMMNFPEFYMYLGGSIADDGTLSGNVIGAGTTIQVWGCDA